MFDLLKKSTYNMSYQTGNMLMVYECHHDHESGKCYFLNHRRKAEMYWFKYMETMTLFQFIQTNLYLAIFITYSVECTMKIFY